MHVSTNGKRLAGLPERLVEEWPEPVEELAIIGYSMGGLVVRSAVHYGTAGNHKWPRELRRLIFLGGVNYKRKLKGIFGPQSAKSVST